MPVKKSKDAKKPAIPLNDIMLALDTKNRQYYSTLTPEQQKSFSAWLLMRYTSSVQGQNNAQYLIMTNELLNKNFSDISGHPELQWLLMSACGSGKKEYHPYIKPPNARRRRDPIFDMLNTIYPSMKNDEIAMLIELNTMDELRELAISHGYDDKAIQEIFGK